MWKPSTSALEDLLEPTSLADVGSKINRIHVHQDQEKVRPVCKLKVVVVTMVAGKVFAECGVQGYAADEGSWRQISR